MGSKKIVGICIIMLVLSVTVFTVTGTKNNNGKVTPYQTLNSWSKTYGGNMIDWGNCIQQTTDGGYIISGTYGRNVWSLWYCYFYLLKIDASGNEEWNKTQGTYDRENVAQSIRQTSDGGYIIAGYSGIPQNMDLYLEKTDSNGNIVWARTFGKPDYCFDLGRSVEQTSDNGYIITGETGSYGNESQNVWLIKTDENGNEQWNKTFGGYSYDGGNCVKITSDGGYIILGYTDSFSPDGTTDVWLIKTDSSGNEEWNKTFGGSDVDEGRSIQNTLDNGYIITGYTYSYGVGGGDVWLIKTDMQGNEEWNKTFGGSDYDEGWCVQQTNDNGFFITGDYGWGSQQPDIYTIKTDSNGNEEWNNTFDKNNAEDVGYYGIQTSDGGYIVSGYTGFFLEEVVDVWVIKFGGENQPPTAPTIDGTAHGKVGVKYTYKFTSTDPDGDDVYYNVSWGCCCDDYCTYGPFASGEEAIINHMWNEKGTFIIKAKAIDTYGAESDLTTLEVIMPKTISYKSLFLKLLERFPNAFPILRHFLGL
jgi:hypothetical protein